MNKQEFTNEYIKHLKRQTSAPIDVATDVDKYRALATIIRNISLEQLSDTKNYIKANKVKQVYYFSMEFLIGRLLSTNLMNLGLYDVANEALNDLGVDLNALEEVEADAGLGNGGLGRLAACFLDSMASTSYAGHGFSIRYRNGFFSQSFENGYQVEAADNWLEIGNEWEVIKSYSKDITFFGHVEAVNVDGHIKYVVQDGQKVRAISYDMPVIGSKNNVVNSLRLFSAIPSDEIPKNMDFKSYENSVYAICDRLYPDDSNYEGKTLRLKQQYFFSAAGLDVAIKHHLSQYETLDNFADKNSLQINDTHPAILVAEFMRVLMDEYFYTWENAWNIVTKSCAYTNHTILAEALEKWDVELFKNLLPRLYMIIVEINQRFCSELFQKNYTLDQISKLAIISHNQVHMAHLAIIGSFSVNGVAALHTQILVEDVMKDWHEIYPNKFNNKTNGITHRRWLEFANPQLTATLKSYIGDEFINNPVNGFEKLLAYKDDTTLITKLAEIKQERKQILADYIYEKEGIKINPNSIFDVQVKRLHAYKRQLLNALHILAVYHRLKTDAEFKKNYVAHTFIFGAKAAPSYYFAKNVIKFINSISTLVNNDPEIGDLLKVVFVTNYNVSYAQKIMPAADISEQISTASYEASGTGNMKFMMNGAITLGTMDGANVEIFELVGDDNIKIFGLNKDEVKQLAQSDYYSSKDELAKSPLLQEVINRISRCDFNDETVHENEFSLILQSLFDENDHYYVLKDFDSYDKAHLELNELYKNQYEWHKRCLVNIAKSGFFSSDRTIEDYVNDIWHLEKLKLK